MATDPTIDPAPVVAPTPRRCENCGAPLQGEHCYACGQPTKGLVRHFSSVMGDFFDTVFNIDSRVLRTLGPLLTRPGFLSLEYFSGRRVRYVTPMRLFLFLSLIAFFAIQASIDVNEPGEEGVTVGAPGKPVEVKDSAIESATTVAQVQAARTSALHDLSQARKELKDVPAGAVGVAGIEIAEQKINESADRRIGWIKQVQANRKAGRPPPPPPSEDREGNFNFPVKGKQWDPVSNPIAFDWLPDAANHSLNKRMARARNVLKASDSSRPVVDAVFNVLPQTLIVLMPIFALMLKIAYWFKRRLYMEHLIVALHSHSFIALALCLVLGFTWMQEWLAPVSGFWHGLFGWAIGLTSAWIPIYLLLMQKRVYAQGWMMTLVKFCVLGICYSVLLGLGLLAAMLIGLLTL
jgi:hypothetical protein